MTNKEAFEKWYARNFLEHIPTHDKPAYFVKFGIGYSSPHVDGAWHGWQAVISYMQEQSDPVGEVVMVKEPEWMNPHESFKWFKTEFPLGTKFYTTPQRQQPLKRLDYSQVELIATNDMFWGENGFSAPKLKWDEFANAIMDEMERINK